MRRGGAVTGDDFVRRSHTVNLRAVQGAFIGAAKELAKESRVNGGIGLVSQRCILGPRRRGRTVKRAAEVPKTRGVGETVAQQGRRQGGFLRRKQSLGQFDAA